MGLDKDAAKPLEDRLLLRMLQPEETKSPGGIVIPTGAQERTMFGVVVARGPGRVTYDGALIGRVCEKNDVVLVGKMAGTECSFGGTKYLIIREADVMLRWPKAGHKFHLPDEREATGVDDFFKRAQLPATTGDAEAE